MITRYRFLSTWRSPFILLFILGFLCPVPAKAQDDDSNIVNGGYRLITAEEEARNRTNETLTSGGRSLIKIEIPASKTGTGYSEWIEYQIPTNYDPSGAPVPMIVCWHGYGTSCSEPAIKSTIDEECEARTWIYLSITGHIQTHFGYEIAQIHCTAAIDYMINDLGFNVDTNRIYMAGFSMGGGAAASYVSRHMSMENPYPVAGLILVASPVDWTDAYESGDAGSQYWLPILLGGTPSEVPFAYKQISSMFLDENDNYVADESMGGNLRHNLPVFITFAMNDPLNFMKKQMYEFIEMLTDMGGTFMTEIIPFHLTPHDWAILDEKTALDFISGFTLADQTAENVVLLADRNARFYWAGVTQSQTEVFSRIAGTVDASANQLMVSEATHTGALNVDCAFAGLDDSDDLRIQYASTDPDAQVLTLAPIATEPTYIVDMNGVLHHDYGYDPGSQEIRIGRAAGENLDLKASFEPYNLTLQVQPSAAIGGTLNIQMGNGDPYDNFLYCFAFDQVETKIGQHHLLVFPFSPTVWWLSSLDPSGGLDVTFHVPSDPSLQNTTLYQQFLTYDTMLKEISNLQATLFY